MPFNTGSVVPWSSRGRFLWWEHGVGGVVTEPAITIPVSLTSEELAQVNRKTVAIDYFDYSV